MPCRGFMFVNRAFIFITAQKRMQYIASVPTLQRIDERLIFSRVRSKSTNQFFFQYYLEPLQDKVTKMFALVVFCVQRLNLEVHSCYEELTL